jgi:hypothetical protein
MKRTVEPCKEYNDMYMTNYLTRLLLSVLIVVVDYVLRFVTRLIVKSFGYRKVSQEVRDMLYFTFLS